MNKLMPHALLVSQMAGAYRERRITWLRRARDYKALDASGTMVRICAKYARDAHHDYLRTQRLAWDSYNMAMEDET